MSVPTIIESIVYLLQPALTNYDAIQCMCWIGNSMDHKVEWPGGGHIRIRVGHNLPRSDHREGYEYCWGVYVDWESPDPEQSVCWEAYLDDDSEHTIPIQVSCRLSRSGWYRYSTTVPVENGIYVNTGPEYLQGYYGPNSDLVEVLEHIKPNTPSRGTPFCLAYDSWSPKWNLSETSSLWMEMTHEPSVETMDEICSKCPKLAQYRPSHGTDVFYRQSDSSWSTDLPPDGVDHLWVHSLADLQLADRASRILIDRRFAAGLLHQYRDTHYHSTWGSWCLLTRRRGPKSARSY